MQSDEIKHIKILANAQQRADSILALLQEMRLDEPACLNSIGLVDQGIAKAVFFFRQAIHIAGFWSDFDRIVGGGRDWISAYVGCALKSSGAIDSPDLRQAIELLLSDRHPSGAWGYCPSLQADMDSTSWATLFLQQSEAEWDSRSAVNILLGHQDAYSGGIRTYLGPQFGIASSVDAGPQNDLSGWCSTHVCVTAAALQALIACGLDRQHPSLEKLAQFIRATQHSDGYWNAYWYRGKTYATAQCVRALVQIGETPESSVLQRAAAWLEATQLPDGSWNDGVEGTPGRVIDTALAVWAGLELFTPPYASLEKAVVWLLEKQRSDGSWDSLPILQIPAAGEHAPWNIKEWPETNVSLTQGVCVPDRNRYFTSATALQALSKWRSRKI